MEKYRNKEKINLYQILQEVGYSKNTAEQPSAVTKSKGFLVLLKDKLPDDQLLIVHDNLLKQNTNLGTKLGALKLAYDVKGYNATNIKINLNVYQEKTDKELWDIIDGEVIEEGEVIKDDNRGDEQENKTDDEG